MTTPILVTPRGTSDEDAAHTSGLVAETADRLGAAFTEWDRRWREEPDRFMDEQAHLATDTTTYGGLCAAYLMKILTEQTT